nr:immunoglobulin heavy chain junction region [Macaca mulatta]MOW46590.1 immunoglobulin heavy chain junction region [Macaca mulatta]MOW46683.1 immunoglobulin heavy chain junction region [Macaca mulatta]MOW50951.1 immunoglobulin heavy chain junction region [Macaca mulatta]MOW51085.1 immunoglobulin heavy chain junction region [Macaca mulatta]
CARGAGSYSYGTYYFDSW